MSDNELTILAWFLALATAGVIGFLFSVFPEYTIAYLLGCTLFFWVMDIEHPKHFSVIYYAFIFLLWAFSPLFLWFSL